MGDVPLRGEVSFHQAGPENQPREGTLMGSHTLLRSEVLGLHALQRQHQPWTTLPGVLAGCRGEGELSSALALNRLFVSGPALHTSQEELANS